MAQVPKPVHLSVHSPALQGVWQGELGGVEVVVNVIPHRFGPRCKETRALGPTHLKCRRNHYFDLFTWWGWEHVTTIPSFFFFDDHLPELVGEVNLLEVEIFVWRAPVH